MQTRVLNNGYWNLKGEDNIIIPTRLMIAPFEDYVSSNDMITYNGTTYVIGVGKPLLGLNKTENEDYFKVSIFSMLVKYMENKTKESFKLLISAPPLAYFTTQTVDSLIKTLVGKHTFSYNEEPFEITISELIVLPETFVAFESINADGIYDDSTIYIIDIGGYTTNVVRIRNGNFTDDDYITLENGMFHIDTQIADYLRSKYMHKNLMCDYDDVEDFRNNGLYFDDDETNTNHFSASKEGIEGIAVKFLNVIEDACKIKKWNLKAGSCKVVVIGGGGSSLYEIIKKNFYNKSVLSPTALWDNLKGLESMKSVLCGE